MTHTQENILQASHSAEFLVGHLRQALTTATSVEGMLVLDLIAQAAALRLKLDQVRNAIDGAVQ